MADPDTLGELASLVRSKNAGPFMLTIDVMFDDVSAYERVRSAALLSADRVGALYGVEPSQVRVMHHPAALAIKVSFPRRIPSGARGDTDVFGGQMHGPLVELPVA